MTNPNAVQQVFDSQHLRHKILTYIVREKYNEELKEAIYKLFSESLVRNWYKYCHCELCASRREYYNTNYGELL